MKWDEFKALLSGLAPDTPLGRIVSIRSEEDKEILKHFNKEQRRIYNEWCRKQVKEVSKESMEDALEQIKKAFIQMAGSR